MTETVVVQEMIKDLNVWQLRQLMEAHNTVRASGRSYEEVAALYVTANEVDTWLRAETNWTRNVERWLQAEKTFHLRKTLLDNDVAYKAAEKGWLAIRGLVPNLDGVNNFGALPPLLQDRYAVFARAVLNDN